MALAKFERFHRVANVLVIDLAGGAFQFSKLADAKKLACRLAHGVHRIVQFSEVLDLSNFVWLRSTVTLIEATVTASGLGPILSHAGHRARSLRCLKNQFVIEFESQRMDDLLNPAKLCLTLRLEKHRMHVLWRLLTKILDCLAEFFDLTFGDPILALVFDHGKSFKLYDEEPVSAPVVDFG